MNHMMQDCDEFESSQDNARHQASHLPTSQHDCEDIPHGQYFILKSGATGAEERADCFGFSLHVLDSFQGLSAAAALPEQTRSKRYHHRLIANLRFVCTSRSKEHLANSADLNDS